MMFKFLVALVLVAFTFAYVPAAQRGQMQMSLKSQFSKAFGIAALGLTLAGPVTMPQVANADGAVSRSTVYRARNNYGAKIVDLQDAVNKGDFSAFENKKIVNAFDLFISGANGLNSKIDKERKVAEKNIVANIYGAVKSKDSNKLRSAYEDFIKVADLKSEYKPNELGQSDSSGYAPTYGTAREYIYQR